MSIPNTYESKLLQPVDEILLKMANELCDNSFETRLQLLEAAASRIGCFPLDQYFSAFNITPIVSTTNLEMKGTQIANALSSIPIHPALALSALAREQLTLSQQRAAGAYYTDFRLAQYLADLGMQGFREESKVLDPACGTGILLVAVSIAICDNNRIVASSWLANCIFAADQSALALRGARLSLSCLTDDIEAIVSMWNNWRVHDSLLVPFETWLDMSPHLFELVIGNPPWEKLKLTRHEYLNANGDNRRYGQEYTIINDNDYLQQRDKVSCYAVRIRELHGLIGIGEPDLYMAFSKLSSKLVRQGGRVALLLPAGLIRSQGTETLRRSLLRTGCNVSITIMDNKARYFAIDTRFKFISLSYLKNDLNLKIQSSIQINHAMGSAQEISITGTANLKLEQLERYRPDLSIPEVRNDKEWEIFMTMSQNGINWSLEDSRWYPEIVREVDMTNDRKNFIKSAADSALAVVEGRMVQAHHIGAKMYISGTGRSASWAPVAKGKFVIAPQFWIKRKDLSKKASERSEILRAGFCDIAGQTNERSMMASLIPPKTVCGNKVPTITFPNDLAPNRLILWIGIVNSFPFDWMLRRVLTTTVNYFLLLSLYLPRLEPDDLPGRYIFKSVETLHKMNFGSIKFNNWKNAELRANIDIAVLTSYGLGYEELVVMLNDFPLLDRGQPPIIGESTSSVTRDFLLLNAAKHFGQPFQLLQERVEFAKFTGAVPYIPSEMSTVELNNLGEAIYDYRKSE